MNYADELNFVAEAEDDKFPKFLFTPIYNDFDDNYYKQSIADDTLSVSARGLRRKYSNFFDYCDAISIYNEYMDALLNKYGSMSIIKNGLRLGYLDEAIPPKPKLKNTKRNREFLRAGAVPSRPFLTEPISADAYIELARMNFPNSFGEDIKEEDRFVKLSKHTKRILNRTQERISGADRRHNLYKNNSVDNGTDFIVEYLNQATKGYYDGNVLSSSGDSILDIIKDEEKYSALPPELVDAELNGNKTIVYNGRIVKAQDVAQIEIMKQLYSIGIDVLGNFGKSMNKNAVKMMRSSIGDAEPMTKKDLKKYKKKVKKSNEIISNRRDSDKILERTLLNNKVDFTSGGNTLNFRLRDLYRD